MKTSQSVGEVRRFLGMTNQLNKFSPLITEKSKPLRDLLAKKTEWVWGHEQASSFQAVKEELSTASILGRYNPSTETLVAADASSFGLGGVICQRQEKWYSFLRRQSSYTKRPSFRDTCKVAFRTPWNIEMS